MDLWLGSRERSDWSIPRSVLIDESDQTELYLQLQGTGGSGVAAGDLAHAHFPPLFNRWAPSLPTLLTMDSGPRG